MLMAANITIREASSRDDTTTVQHFRGMWLGMAYPEDKLRPDFAEQTLHFIAEARQLKHYKAFIAEADGKAVGSVCCQLFGGLYPLVFVESAR